MSKQATEPSTEQFVSLEELLSQDSRNLAHRPDGTIMTNYEREQIEAHYPQISEGLQNKELKTAEQLDVRAGYFERPKYGHDRVLFDAKNGLFGIFDGVGGDQNPAETATLVRDIFASDETLLNLHTVKDETEVVSILADSFSNARAKVHEVMGRDAGYTTATVAKLFTMDKKIHIGVASAGDSPFMIRRAGKMLMFNAIPGTGSAISNAIGRDGATLSKDYFHVMSLEEGDRVLLCSDGITGDTPSQTLSEEEFADALDRSDPQTAAERLTNLSKKSDDKSVIVLAVGASAETPTIREALKAKKAKVAGFIAGLGIAQKVRGVKITGSTGKVRAVAKNTGSKINYGARNAAAWTAVKGDSLVAAAKSKETYTDLQDRVSSAFNRAKDELTKLYIRAGDKLSERVEKHREKMANLTEEEQQRRRKIIGRALGIAVVGVASGIATYKILYGMDSSGNGQHNFLADILPQDQSDSKGDGPKHHNGAHHHAHHGQGQQTPEHNNHHNNSESKHVPRQLSLDEQGSSIWGSIDETAEQRGVHLTDAQTYDLVTKTLHYNDLSWEDARHLPQGYDFRMPEEVRRVIEEEATKKKKVH